MKKLSAFWYVFKRSLTDPEYYRELLTASFSFSLKYLLALLFFVLLVKGLIFSLSLTALLPKMPTYVSEAKNVVREFYPKELTITINNGLLRTNVDEPYTIHFPKELGITDTDFAVIDTKSSVENYKKYKTVIFVTKNAVAYPDGNTENGYKVYPLSQIKRYVVLNSDVYQKMTSQILPYFNYAPQALIGLALVALIFFPVIGTVFYLSSMLIYLLILTVIVYFLARVMKNIYDYKTLYRISMHAITFSILFDLLKSFFGLSIPLTFVMPYLIWMLIVFNSLKGSYGNTAAGRSA